ncbi:MAG TPA: 50S ribosomal protein L18 [Planctomycetota bacterium]|nr:50S ribosomal protein L18 [Planctomycetota bacterium]
MDQQKAKSLRRWKRHRRVRKSISGTAQRPRLSIYRSLRHIYCQVVDDDGGRTLLSVSTQSSGVKESVGYGGNQNAAKAVGKVLAEIALGQGIKQMVLDRGGCKYHGRLAALADSAREAGLKI